MKRTEIQCLCGAVKLRVEGEPVNQFYCHCDDCQAISGGAYVGVAVFPSDAVTIAQGAPVAFHINCRYAVLPVKDDLPHFKGFPAKFGGSDETVDW